MKIAEMIKLGAKGFKPSDIKELSGSGMSTDDVIKLAESGYSVADVKELISLAGSEENIQPQDAGADDQQGPADPSDNSGDNGQPDYKAMYEAQEAELVKTRKSLETLQQQNSRRNLGGAEQKTSRDKVQEIFKNLY